MITPEGWTFTEDDRVMYHMLRFLRDNDNKCLFDKLKNCPDPCIESDICSCGLFVKEGNPSGKTIEDI